MGEDKAGNGLFKLWIFSVTIQVSAVFFIYIFYKSFFEVNIHLVCEA